MEEMRLQDMSYNGAPDPSHYLAPEGSTLSRGDTVYADRQWVPGSRQGIWWGLKKCQTGKGFAL